MSQIRKAFELAIKENALKNFKTIFYKALNETAEQSLATAKNSLAFPEVTSKNIAELQPKELLLAFATKAENLLEEMFQTACRKARHEAYCATYGQLCTNTLGRMNDTEFRELQKEVITEYLSLKGTPASILIATMRATEYFFAQALLEKAVATCNEDKEFDIWLDEAITEAANTAFLNVADINFPEALVLYKTYIRPQVISELLALRRRATPEQCFADVIKSAMGAFFCRKP